MAIQVLNTKPNEKGTAVITVVPKDQSDTTLTFAQLTNPQWQMITAKGTIVDGCSFDDSSLTALTWVISGDQLALFGTSDTGIRRITFKATYDSDLGNALPIHDECQFEIDPCDGIINSETE